MFRWNFFGWVATAALLGACSGEIGGAPSEARFDDGPATSGTGPDLSGTQSSCEPESCLSMGMECGQRGDGCGGDLSCGSCAGGQTCESGFCFDVSPAPPGSCEPESCLSLGNECGDWSDGCGGTLKCGSCASDETCASRLCIDASPAPPPPAGAKRFSASRTSCLAPCAVQFNAQSTEQLSWAQFLDSRFVWDFDDGAGSEGFLAAHVFDSAGTYSVGLTVDGTGWAHQTITVSAPTRMICVSPGSQFGDCPSQSGSDHYTSLGAALGQDQTNVHVLLHRGENFGSFSGFGDDGPTLYGAYGSGAKPKLSMTSEGTIGTNVVWQDLDITAHRILNLSNWSVLRRIDARGTIGGDPQYWAIAYYVNDFFVFHCNTSTGDGGNGGVIYSYQAQRSAIVGNTFDRQAGGTGHNVRVNGNDSFLIQNNTFSENGGPDSLTIRGDQPDNAYWTLVQGNTFENMWPVIKPQYAAANELVQYVIWEKNVHRTNLRIETAHDVMVRDNTFLEAGAAVSIVDHSDFYDPRGITAIDNTCGSGDCSEMIVP